jgi:hypothetical protein
MSNTKREPLFSDDMIQTALNLERMFHMREKDSENEADIWSRGVASGIMQSRQRYEAARAKDAELIQKLVDAMAYRMSHRFGEEQFREMYYAGGGVSPSTALAIADAAGFKPSTP